MKQILPDNEANEFPFFANSILSVVNYYSGMLLFLSSVMNTPQTKVINGLENAGNSSTRQIKYQMDGYDQKCIKKESQLLTVNGDGY